MPCTPLPGGGFSCGPTRRCKTPGCGRRAVALCDWKMHRVEDGKKVYTGRDCNAGMCDQHRSRVGDKDLCAPHHAEARRRGYVKETP